MASLFYAILIIGIISHQLSSAGSRHRTRSGQVRYSTEGHVTGECEVNKLYTGPLNMECHIPYMAIKQIFDIRIIIDYEIIYEILDSNEHVVFLQIRGFQLKYEVLVQNLVFMIKNKVLWKLRI